MTGSGGERDPFDSDDEDARPFGWWQELGDEFDDDLEPTAPLPLEDRLWRHPSELASPRTPAHDPIDRNRLDRRLLAGVAVAAGLAGASLALGAMLLIGPGSSTVTERVVERQLDQPVTRFASQSPAAVDVAQIADASKPSIVTVEARNSIGSVVGAGSGVIVRSDGHVISNHHVIDGAAEFDVITSDGHRHAAVVVGSDPLTDIAVLRIDPGDHELLPAMLGTTAQLRVGEPAVAIGSPLRLDGGPTVTVGRDTGPAVTGARRAVSPGDRVAFVLNHGATMSSGGSVVYRSVIFKVCPMRF